MNIASAILSGLFEIARRVGKWLVRRLSLEAVTHVISFLHKRIAKLGRRLNRAKNKHRKVLLTFRIDALSAAVMWIERNSDALKDTAVREYCSRVDYFMPGAQESSC